MANYKSSLMPWFWHVDMIAAMRDFLILFVHLIVTLARLARPGGLRSVVAESTLVRYRVLVLIADASVRPTCVPRIVLSPACAPS